MKKWLLSSIFLSSSVFATLPEIEANQAGLHIEQQTIVCGQVAEVKKGKKQTYINIGRKYPNQAITFLVWDDQLSPFLQKFSSLSTLTNQRVCANGKVRQYKQQLQIIVNETQHLWIAR